MPRMKSRKLHTRKELWRVRGLIKKRADGEESLRRQYETQLEKQIWVGPRADERGGESWGLGGQPVSEAVIGKSQERQWP